MHGGSGLDLNKQRQTADWVSRQQLRRMQRSHQRRRAGGDDQRPYLPQARPFRTGQAPLLIGVALLLLGITLYDR